MREFDAVVAFESNSMTRGMIGDNRFSISAEKVESYLLANQFTTREYTIRVIDFLRIAGTVFALDRIVKRDSAGSPRSIKATIPVHDLGFWNQSKVLERLHTSVGELAQEKWTLQFTREANPVVRGLLQRRLDFRARAPMVCLYSGGLDSAAGLAGRLKEDADSEFLALMIGHASLQVGNARKQWKLLEGRFGGRLKHNVVRARFALPSQLRNPRTKRFRSSRFRDQENTQRCRSFLYTAVAGVVASSCGSSAVEMYESGIGAINLPLLHTVGPMPTRRCNPRFLKAMGQLLELVVGIPIAFRLPYFHKTKAEVVQQIQSQGLNELIPLSYSCVHGMNSQCGWCPGCVFRQYAVIIAGFETLDRPYSHQLFGERDVTNALPDRCFSALKAILAQIYELESLDNDDDVPVPMAGHLLDVFRDVEVNPSVIIDLFRRYRREWLQLVTLAQARGYQWADMMRSTAIA